MLQVVEIVIIVNGFQKKRRRVAVVASSGGNRGIAVVINGCQLLAVRIKNTNSQPTF